MKDELTHRRPMQFRVTIGADDAPALFRALSNVKSGRQRVLRFRELAIQGLLIEQLGFQAQGSSGVVAAAPLVVPLPAAAASAMPSLATAAIDSWGADPEDPEPGVRIPR